MIRYTLIGGAALGIAAGLTPGPVVTEILRRATTGGTRAALAVAGGAALGNTSVALGAATGVGAVLSVSGMAWVLGLSGAAWIAYLGVVTWRQARSLKATDGNAESRAAGSRSGWLVGVLIVVTNPIVWAFWAASLAMASGGAPRGAAGGMFAAGFIGGITVSDVTLSLVSARGARWLSPRAQALTLRVCAALLLGFALLSLVRLIHGSH